MFRAKVIFAQVTVLAVLLTTPVAAAPTCQDIEGHTIRCGTAGAMPIGWKLQQPPAVNSSAEFYKWLQAFCAVGVLFALLAAMPDFESTTPAEWDREEDMDKGEN